MKIEYCRNDGFNFGDDLNKWLWPKLLGDCLDPSDNIYLVGIGTLLTSKRFNKTLSGAKKIVILSSGAWERDYPELDNKTIIYGVRGPRTAKKLGISEDFVVGDGAYLLRTLPLNPVALRFKTAFIPHHRSEQYVDWEPICEAAGMKLVSTRQPVDRFIAEIRSCEKVISEAMHGAIAADAFRIPWVGTRFAPNFNEEKWLDWCEALDIRLELHTLPTIYQNRPPFLRSLENYLKLNAPNFISKGEKWKNLPVAFRKASSADVESLILALKTVDAEARINMSTDEKVAEITQKLNGQVKKLAADYKTGLIQ
ncbi:succinoglycan biosynthesis protein ExoV [Marinobacter sp. LV10R520-4]|uniref:polysaccharide pyruvyl transferase family protein n=1 Tax=Marinobacter sp. LV10R520-4 TaxID=1761796 RepID=UPI000BF5029F|nr:polysaccharide pyruvyl transferase family protein [Marinobacter sp. LV10R520-4]PFG51843.1 succinoglycan biosynthesis protein ExoV [Marinobacter sp. LV10R520-4]